MNDPNELARESLSRRNFLGSGLGIAAALSLSTAGVATNVHAAPDNRNHRNGTSTMNTITTKDGTEIFYKDWGPKNAQPIVFHHGWPLSADDWDTQMLFFLDKGYRVVAHDRRGHGRSSQVSDGHDMDHYAADAAAVFEHLNLRNAVHIGHSTGGGEATHYVARHGLPQGRVAKLVLIGAVPPLMLKTPANPGGLPMEVLDGLRKVLAENRSQFYIDFPSGPFYGYNRPGAKPSQAIIQNWWRQAMMGGAKAQYEGIRAFSETDFTEDLKIIDVPTLVMHGDDDQIVPIADSACSRQSCSRRARSRSTRSSRTACARRTPTWSIQTCSPSSRGSVGHGQARREPAGAHVRLPPRPRRISIIHSATGSSRAAARA